MKLTHFSLKKVTLTASAAFFLLVFPVANVDVLAKSYEKSASLNQHITFSQATKENKLHYAYSGDPTKPGLLFIHGTPGGWGAFEVYLESPRLQKDFFMVSVDRLGWGQSLIASHEINGEFAPHAQGIKAVMDKYPNKSWTLIGHSLGASIAPKIALLAPKQTKSLLLLAGSLKPGLGRPRWYNRAASTWVVSRLIGESMRYSNREIMGLRKQLEIMDQEIKQQQLPTDLVIMQGRKDRLVSPKNPAYVADAWKAHFKSIKLIELEEEGHFLPWNQTPLIIETIYQLNQ